jgi:hypothetical protein
VSKTDARALVASRATTGGKPASKRKAAAVSRRTRASRNRSHGPIEANPLAEAAAK